MSETTMDLGETRWRISELLDRRRIDAARALLTTALRQHPEHGGLLYEAARADFLDDRPAQARELLQSLLRRDPADAAARYLLFWVCGELREWVDAEGLILALLRDFPQQPDYWAAYAHLCLRCLLFAKASALCAEALHLDAQHPFALRMRVLCDLVEGKAGGAALQRLLLDSPDDAQTLRLVVVSLAQRGRASEALRLARELLRSQPNDRDLLDQLRELAFLNHWTMAPLRPLNRFGWAGVAGVWVGALLLGRFVDAQWPAWSTSYYAVWLGFVVYSWVWPPLLKRWLRRGD